MRWRGAGVGAAVLASLAALVGPGGARADAPPSCAPAGPPVVFTGSVTTGDAKTYISLPFSVAAGTTRVEATYDWVDPLPLTPLTQTVFDLGLWDSDGLGTADGFRGWSGSRAGRVGTQPPVFVQQDVAQRGYRPAPIDAGVWTVDLGVAAVGNAGADWTVTVTCTAPVVGAPFVPDPVDAAHVADTAAGWYHGDFHMHGFHSSGRAPSFEDEAVYAQSVGLDFLPITDYVTGQHWDELGQTQRDHPDLLIWPGREIITYFGHANALGETRDVLDYRHGAEGVSLLDIERATVADGALFQVNHPTTFPGPVFQNFCRGCEFTLGSVIDWELVTTMEVLTGPVLASSEELSLPDLGFMIQNPFTQPAIDLWESQLLAGHRITGVSGSDSKGVNPDPRQMWGSSATAVYARELSRPALIEALRAGHAYVRTLGVAGSPEVEVTAVAPDGSTGIVGDTLGADQAQITVTVRGGQGQVLLVNRNGDAAGLPVLIDADPFTYTFLAARDASTEGPLGTFWRFDTEATRADVVGTFLTTIGNPVFLAGPAGSGTPVPGPGAAPGGVDARRLPATGGSGSAVLPAAVLLGAALAFRVRGARAR